MNAFNTIYNEAQLAFDSGKHSEARILYLQLLKNHPNGHADVYNNLGLILHHNGDIQYAIDFFKKVLTINPKYTAASLNLTIAYNDAGKYDDANGTFSQAAEIVQNAKSDIDPFLQGKLANEHAKLGDTYYEVGQIDEAEEQYRKVLSMRPNFVDVLTSLGIILREKGNIDEAIENFRKAKTINPRYTRALIHLGISYYKKGLTDLAFIEWEEIQKINPDGKEAEIYLSMARNEAV
ncbi:tetratricopeptide repeat protein [Nitrospira defluvii]|nr:tetratricopeptide repeat protein [Nitrospira defluvii]